MTLNTQRLLEVLIIAVVAAIIAVLVLGSIGCSSIPKELIDKGVERLQEELQEKTEPEPTPEPVVEPEPQPEPQPEPEPINHGGDGLYKPESQLWLLPRYHPNGQQMQCRMLGRAGEYRDEAGTQLVKYFRVGSRQGPVSSGGPYNIPDGEGMHNYRVKLRDAKATASGNWFLAWDINNNLIYKMQIIDRNVRQE